MDVFFEIHKDLPREGPGSDESTRKALALIPSLPQTPRILDVGCGPGRQTLELARSTNGHILAVDTHPPYLERLARQAAELGFSERIETIQASMEDLPFDEGEFDLIWSEGAIYIMGFEKGFRSWRPLLKRGGALAVTELSWLRAEVPERARRFMDNAYPAMKSRQGNLEVIKRTGYESVGHFTLPSSDWWDDYYHPMERRIGELRRAHHDNPDALTALDQEMEEIVLFRDFSDYYGYEFYVMRKAGD